MADGTGSEKPWGIGETLKPLALPKGRSEGLCVAGGRLGSSQSQDLRLHPEANGEWQRVINMCFLFPSAVSLW